MGIGKAVCNNESFSWGVQINLNIESSAECVISGAHFIELQRHCLGEITSFALYGNLIVDVTGRLRDWDWSQGGCISDSPSMTACCILVLAPLQLWILLGRKMSWLVTASYPAFLSTISALPWVATPLQWCSGAMWSCHNVTVSQCHSVICLI